MEYGQEPRLFLICTCGYQLKKVRENGLLGVIKEMITAQMLDKMCKECLVANLHLPPEAFSDERRERMPQMNTDRHDQPPPAPPRVFRPEGSLCLAQLLNDLSLHSSPSRAWTRPQKAPTKPKKVWTEEEHRAFLRGMHKYGKGAWKLISQEFVPTRTSQQLASHCQHFFRWQKKPPEARNPNSLFAITKP